MRLLLVLAVVAACSGGKPTPTPERPPATEPNTDPSAEHSGCTADDDCVIVETACCDHCNGGKAEAFNKAFADQHKPTACEGTSCTMRGCGPAIAKCEAGVCAVTIGEL